MNRRTFFLSATTAGWMISAQADQIRLGLIGAGGRGRYVAGVARQHAGAAIAGVCDVYEPNLEKGLSELGNQAKAYRNYKALLDDKSINAVIIATPEHWHHRMLLDALAAGKDIYIEKPICQTPEQGVELVDAVKRSKSIVQVGTQRRSYDLYLKARKIVEAGTLGNVRMVRCWWLNNMLGGGAPGPLKGPLDWEQWQGPARRREMTPGRFQHWRYYSDYAGGIMADQGAHVFDGVQMLMGAGYVSVVNASAGKIHRAEVDTPESVVVCAEYPEDFLAVFTLNYAAMPYKPANDQLNQFDGDKARLDVSRDKLAIFARGSEEQAMLQETSGGTTKASEDHVKNFIECIRDRKPATATVEGAFQAALVTQMANISLREGRRVRWNRNTRKVEVG
ncbi:MAG: Gfo/Idh/MocA family oxidoreductase [Bryobacteraceae bacterium]